MKIVEIKDDYINYLKKYFSKTLMDNKEGKRIHGRKYLGVVLKINEYQYFAPLSSPKQSDYFENQNIRPSSKIVIRMTREVLNGPELMGTIKLNNMIPVPDFEIVEYDIDNELDARYKDLVSNELFWIQRNSIEIKDKANYIYKLKKNEVFNRKKSNSKFYDSIMPFIEAEKKCDEYIKLNKVK